MGGSVIWEKFPTNPLFFSECSPCLCAGLRGIQFGQVVESASSVHLWEQPLCHGHKSGEMVQVNIKQIMPYILSLGKASWRRERLFQAWRLHPWHLGWWYLHQLIRLSVLWMVLAPTEQMKITKYYKLHGVHCEGMDVLAVREATRFAIDYCSVQAKVTLTHNVSSCHLVSVTGPTCLWNFHLPVSWTLNVWSWNQLPHQVEYDNWPWPLATTALKCHNCLLMPPVPIQVFKNTFLLQGRSSGDAKDKRPNHRVPRSHHRSRACRDFWDQSHRAWSETKCWCGCEESQGKIALDGLSKW